MAAKDEIISVRLPKGANVMGFYLIGDDMEILVRTEVIENPTWDMEPGFEEEEEGQGTLFRVSKEDPL